MLVSSKRLARLSATVAAAGLAACGGNPVVPFPTASNTPTVSTTPAAPAGQAGPISTYNFACNEGIPLIVVVDNASGGSRLTYSHDSFPYREMTQVPGSPAFYSDGTYQLQLQGNQAVLSYADGSGVFDSCVRV